jgi:acyl carrier protein
MPNGTETDMTDSSAISRSDIEAAIADYLQGRFPMLGTVGMQTELLGSGAIDSLGFLEVVTFLEERFAIILDDDDFDAANLKDASTLADLAERKLR